MRQTHLSQPKPSQSVDKPTVASVGNLNLDVYFRVQALPESDSAVEAYEAYIGGGGSAANFAVQASKLGIHSRFIGATGTDMISDALLEDLKDAGVDITWVKRISAERSGLVVVLIGPDEGRRMIEYRGANLGLAPVDINTNSLSNVNHLHLATSRLNIIEAGVKLARELGITTSIDGGAGLALRGLDVLAPIVRWADVWFMNSLEASRLAGQGGVKSWPLLMKWGLTKCWRKGPGKLWTAPPQQGLPPGQAPRGELALRIRQWLTRRGLTLPSLPEALPLPV